MSPAKPKTFKALKQPAADQPATAGEFIVASLQALRAGTATAHQQQSALEWIIKDASRAHAPAYYPNTHDTAFALGRACVGEQILGFLQVDLTPTAETQN